MRRAAPLAGLPQVQNTVLKEPRVGKNIPTVARMTQVRRHRAPVTHRYDTVTTA